MGTVELREAVTIRLGETGIVSKENLKEQYDCPEVVDSFVEAWVEAGVVKEDAPNVYTLTEHGKDFFGVCEDTEALSRSELIKPWKN